MGYTMSDYEDKHFFELRKEGKIYISKVFKYRQNLDEMRNIKIVFENSNTVALGEIKGTLSLRKSDTGKNQIAVVVTQDDKQVVRLSLEKFREVGEGYNGSDKEKFTFTSEEWERLHEFLTAIKFIDLSNRDRHQIEDISTNSGNKTIIDSSETAVIDLLKNLKGEERASLLEKIKSDLTKEDIQILLGRKEALEIFKKHLTGLDWTETQWQSFFKKENWIFGYGLDYRFSTTFDREMNVTSAGTDNKEKSVVDFLNTFTDFTITVELKKPQTQIFDKQNKPRSGIWGFHTDFIEAYSQVLEQKAEWHITGQRFDNYNKSGTKSLTQRTRDSKAILVIGSKTEISNIENIRERDIKLDTFELFRRDSRNVEIITYDELYERAGFIVKHGQL